MTAAPRGLPRGLSFALLALLFLAGTAAQLLLTEPLWFPSPRLRPRGAADLLAMAVLAAEGLAALLVLLRSPPGAFARLGALRAGFGILRPALLLALLLVLTVSPMGFLGPRGSLAAWGANLAAAGLCLGIHLAALAALLGLAPPAPLARLALPHPAIAAAVATAASLALALLAFEGVPHVEDEVAYLFQARTFAEGALTAPAPPEAARAALDYYLFEVAGGPAGGRWFAVTAPGWSFALAAGVILGAPALVNPLLAGLAVLLGALVLVRAGRSGTEARLAALLMAGSPWFLVTGASLMTHMLCLALMLGAWALLLGPRRERGPEEPGRWARPGPALLAGLLLGWMFLTRPVDGLIAGGLTGLVLLLSPGRPRSWPAILACGAGCLLAGGLVFPYNLALTGDPLLTPLAAHLARLWGEGANAFGLGPGIGPPQGWGALDPAPGRHSLGEGLLGTLNNLVAAERELFGWGTGSLLFALAFLLWGRLRAPGEGLLRLLLVLAGATVATLVFYWFAGSFYIGPRYWFPAFFPLVVLSVRGALLLGPRLEGAATGGAGLAAPGGPRAALALLLVSGLLLFVPWLGIAKYPGYGNYDGRIDRLARAGAFGEALVLVGPGINVGAALALNDPWLRPGRPVFVLAPEDEAGAAALAGAFPGREVVRFDPRAPLPARR